MKISTECHGSWLDNRGHKHTEWSAIDTDTYDGAEDSRSPVGLGATKEDALIDLVEKILDNDRRREAHHLEFRHAAMRYLDHIEMPMASMAVAIMSVDQWLTDNEVVL